MGGNDRKHGRWLVKCCTATTLPGLALLHKDDQTQLSPASELVTKHSLAVSIFGSQKQPGIT